MNLYSFFLKHPHICTDTRKIVPNSIFFALRGDNFNANAFAADALEKGCIAAVVDEEKYAVNEQFILVENTLETLQKLANAHRRAWGKTIIGITGTNGKTTTKELISIVLSTKFATHFTQGNLNNHIGVPLTLLQLTENHEIAVIEMGANHPKEIAELCTITEPNFGIITNVGRAHLEGFGSFEGVMYSKSELYKSIDPQSKIFINADNHFLAEMAEKAGIKEKQKVYYSLYQQITGQFGNNDNVIGKIIDCSPFLKMNVKIATQNIDIQTKLVGAYNAENVLAAVCVGHFFGVKNENIKTALENYTPSNNRSQLVETKRNNHLIVDAYNANASSMQAAIENFAQIKTEHKTLILGDMLELGEASEAEHKKIVDLLQQNGFSRVILVGENFEKTAKDIFPTFENVEKLLTFLNTQNLVNQYILLKGSHGTHLEKAIEYL